MTISITKVFIVPLFMGTYICTFRQAADGNDDWHFYGDNVALHKNANELPAAFYDKAVYDPHSSKVIPAKYYTASLAVDGNTDGYFKHGSCSHTIGKSIVDASWTVDLGSPFNVTGIVIYNREDVKFRLKNFLIYGDDVTLIHNSSGTEEYKEDILTFKLDGLLSFSTITILLPKHHGYSDGGNYYLTLCEVEIYAAQRPACDVRRTQVTNGQTEIFNHTGRVINHQYTVGSIIQVFCKENFYLVGPSSFQCLTTGKYDYAIPKCVDSHCILPNVTNGKFINVLSTKFEVGTTLQFTCYPGFTTTSSKDTIKCGENFQWSDTPVCQAQSDTSGGNAVIIGVVISVVCVSVIILVIIIFIYRRRKRRQQNVPEPGVRPPSNTSEVPGRT